MLDRDGCVFPLAGLEDVLVVAASNRPELIDDALLRPGRLDRRVSVDEPDEAARREIFEIHTRDRPLADDVDEIVLTSDHFAEGLAAVSPEAVQEFGTDSSGFDDVLEGEA